MKKAPNKDRPGLLDDAARLADAGRRGDKVIAHITPEEAALLKARGGSGTTNPRTGLLEFWGDGPGGDDGQGNGGGTGVNDGMGTGGVGNDNGGTIGGTPTEGWSGYDSTPSGGQGVDPWAGTLGGQVGPKAGPSYADQRGFLGSIGDNILANLQDMGARPGETISNLALGALVPGYSIMNAAVAAGKPGNTLAGYAIDGMKGGVKSEYMGADDTPSGPSTPTDPNGQNDSRGGSDTGVAAPRSYAPTPQQTAEQIAQQALREAIVKPPAAFNSWLGNRFQIPQNPGTPKQYNSWAGNRFQIPGLLS